MRKRARGGGSPLGRELSGSGRARQGRRRRQKPALGIYNRGCSAGPISLWATLMRPPLGRPRRPPIKAPPGHLSPAPLASGRNWPQQQQQPQPLQQPVRQLLLPSGAAAERASRPSCATPPAARLSSARSSKLEKLGARAPTLSLARAQAEWAAQRASERRRRRRRRQLVGARLRRPVERARGCLTLLAPVQRAAGLFLTRRKLETDERDSRRRPASPPLGGHCGRTQTEPSRGRGCGSGCGCGCRAGRAGELAAWSSQTRSLFAGPQSRPPGGWAAARREERRAKGLAVRAPANRWPLTQQVAAQTTARRPTSQPASQPASAHCASAVGKLRNLYSLPAALWRPSCSCSRRGSASASLAGSCLSPARSSRRRRRCQSGQGSRRPGSGPATVAHALCLRRWRRLCAGRRRGRPSGRPGGHFVGEGSATWRTRAHLLRARRRRRRRLQWRRLRLGAT